MSAYAKNVLPIIRGTREILLPQWGVIKQVRKKDDDMASPVTPLDLQIETLIKDGLAAIYPEIGFAGEEFGGSREVERFWLCDPIDGTGNFIHGLPFATVMLALVEHQQVVFGVIYDFVNDIAYHATRGQGAFANDTPIHVSDRPLSAAYLTWEMHMDKPENRELYWKLFQQKAGLLDTMCAGWEFAMVASGRCDGRVTVDPWGFDFDFAPGSLLVEEAGGIVANIGKNTYDYRDGNFLAVNPIIFKELTEGSGALFPIREN